MVALSSISFPEPALVKGNVSSGNDIAVSSVGQFFEQVNLLLHQMNSLDKPDYKFKPPSFIRLIHYNDNFSL